MVGAAAILVYREHGWASVVALLQRSFDFKRVKAKIWYLPTILLMPAIMVLSYAVQRQLGMSLPEPHFSVGTTLLLVGGFLIAGISEELGWSGYAIDPLQDRYGALIGAVLLGLAWAGWHVIPLLSASRTPGWIVWWSLGTLTSRVLITWLYNNTGRSVFVAALFHAMVNVTYFLFPIDGSFYDPRVTGLIMAVVVVIIVIVWGPRTLVRAQPARSADATN
jgi:membrane protease YdiL (CAAX protease family)